MTIQYKWECLRTYFENKKVLDLGCVGHTYLKESTPDFFHGKIKKVASYLLGVDILDSDISKLNKLKYNVIQGDVQRLEKIDSFDVVFAGELIEHLANFHGFFVSIEKNLKEDGCLILTTPNAFFLLRMVLVFLNKKTARSDHTCFFDKTTLDNLLSMYGYQIVDMKYVKTVSISDIKNTKTILSFCFEMASYLLERIIPRIGYRDIVVVAKKNNG